MKITAKQYAKALLELTEGKTQAEVEGVIARFVETLFGNGHPRLVPKVIEQFGGMWDAAHGIITAQVTTKRALENSQIDRIKDFLQERYQAKEAEIRNIIDGDIKGGMIIRVGDEVIDGSLANQLARLKSSLAK